MKGLIKLDEIKNAASVLRAVNHKLRLEILELIDRKKKLTVSDIHMALNIEQSVCSNHLSILRKEGIVGVERAEKYRYYFIEHSRIAEINTYAEALIK